MTPISPPTIEVGSRRRRRGVGFFAAVAVTLVAAPAALAAVWSTNEVNTTIALTSCLSKSASLDALGYSSAATDNFYIDFDETTSNTDAATGATLTQESLSIRVPAGFRTYSTDTFTINADACGYNFEVRLRANPTNSFGEAAVPNWDAMGLRMFLSEDAIPGDDFGVAADWDQTPLVVNASGIVTVATTGTALLLDDSSLTVGFEVVGAGATGDTGTFNFQVELVPIPV